MKSLLLAMIVSSSAFAGDDADIDRLLEEVYESPTADELSTFDEPEVTYDADVIKSPAGNIIFIDGTDGSTLRCRELGTQIFCD